MTRTITGILFIRVRVAGILVSAVRARSRSIASGQKFFQQLFVIFTVRIRVRVFRCPSVKNFLEFIDRNIM